MKNAIKALAACVAILFAFAAWAIEWTYTISGDEATLGNGSSSAIPVSTEGSITVPDTLGGKPVTRIGSCAFQNCTKLTYVEMPNTVRSIGPSAFMGCTALVGVDLSANLTEIDNYAFHGCSALYGFDGFPDSLTTVGKQAFYGCSSLVGPVILPKLTSLGDEAFVNCTSLDWAELPASFCKDGDPKAKYFSGCKSSMVMASRDVAGGLAWHFRLVDGGAEIYPEYDWDPAIDYNTEGAIAIPSTLCNRPVVSIGKLAFASCYDITSVTIPSGVTSIGWRAFVNCGDLTEVTIPASVASIEKDAFEWTSLETVYVGAGDTARVRGMLEKSGYDVEEVAFVEGGGQGGQEKEVVPVAGVWYTTRAEAFAAARKTGKKVFMICGHDGCLNTMYTKNYSCEKSSVKAELVAKCELWYSNCNTQFDENYYYWPNGTFTLPLVCVIDPDNDKGFIVRSTGLLEPEDITALLAGIPYPAEDPYVDIDPFYPGEMTGYKVINPADIWNPLQAPKAVTLMGALYYGNDVVGVLELKVGKMKNYEAKVSGSATLLDGKKYTIKSEKRGFGDTLASTLTLDIKGGGSMKIAIGSMGGAMVFSGSFDKWHVQTANVGGNWGKSTATANVKAVTIGSLPDGIMSEFLPASEVAAVSGGKWKFAKAASVKWTKPKNGAQPVIYDATSGKGLVVDTSKGTNLSGLKLTYTPKKGTFKGSFKMYELNGSGSATKLKKYTVSVNGVVVDGVGRGKATCKNPVISWPVTVE